MTNERIQNEISYRLSVILIDNLLSSGRLKENEYEILRESLIKKYNPPFGELERDGVWKIVKYRK